MHIVLRELVIATCQYIASYLSVHKFKVKSTRLNLVLMIPNLVASYLLSMNDIL